MKKDFSEEGTEEYELSDGHDVNFNCKKSFEYAFLRKLVIYHGATTI